MPGQRQPVPPYLRIAQEMREKIEHGQWLPGEQVPSMADIASTYEVSRGTARRVLTTLRDWGLVEVTPGWGTFVAERR